MLPIITIAYIISIPIELLFNGILLKRQWNNNIEKFEKNKKDLMNSINLSVYKLGSGHIYISK